MPSLPEDANPLTADLVARAQAGDRGAYDQLFELHARRLATYLRLRMGPKLAARIEVADALQETYVEALGAFERFEDRGPGSFSRWLCRLAENRLRGLADHFDAAKRQPPRDAGSAALARVPDPATGPATAAAKGDRDEQLVVALEGLEPDEREALLAYFFEGRTYAETAARMDRSETAVRRLVGRATWHAGGALGEFEGDPKS